MSETAFFRAHDAAQAVDLLRQYGGKAKLLAGGTDLMVKLNRGFCQPEVLIYIGEAGLAYVREDNAAVLIGAGTTFTEVLRSEAVNRHFPLLVEAVRQMAAVGVRNSATIGGNLCNASPAADAAIPLLALGAQARILSSRGERTIEFADFFRGPGQSVLEQDELLAEVIVPKQDDLLWAYRKIGRRRADSLSVVSAAITMKLADGKCSRVRIALGAVAPVPLVATGAAGLLEGKSLDAERIGLAAAAADEETTPIDDGRGTAWYRKRACRAIVKNLLSKIGG